MRLAGRRAKLFLTDEGKEFLCRIAEAVEPSEGPPKAFVEETDETGIWIRVRREEGLQVLLLRWEFILGLEMPPLTGKVVGLKG